MTTAARTEHDDFRETAALYALGALASGDAKEFEKHLASCPECVADMRAMSPAVAALAYAVPQIDPPPELKQRVLSSAGSTGGRHVVSMLKPPPKSPAPWTPWLAAAAGALAAVGLGIYSLQLRSRVDELNRDVVQARLRLETSEREVANVRRIASDAQTTVRVIAAPDLRRSDLAGQQPVAPRASARAFWSQSRGLVFTASNLPQLPAGRTYQLWIVPAGSAAPISAAIFAPDASGSVEQVIGTPLDAPQPMAMAVTIEPAGGVPAPTGDKYLVGTISQL